MNIDPYAYNITVRRAMFEGEVCFEARVKELPDLIEYADTADEAYALAVDGIETTADKVGLGLGIGTAVGIAAHAVVTNIRKHKEIINEPEQGSEVETKKV